jgi:hypothetical protein
MSEGALLDLVARGRKDAYFIGAAPGSRRFWGAEYERRGGSAREVRIEYPETGARFGHWVDIELPRYGDVLMSADIRIQMPTWLPPEIAALNRETGVDVTVESAQWPGTFLHYGWTNGIGNYIVERWALFADSRMLQEGWGDFNVWFPDMETTHMKAPILHATTGTHAGTEQKVQWNATTPELVFRLPIVGLQGDDDAGLPLCALRGQRLYVRLWLAAKELMVESGVKEYVHDPVLNRELPVYELCPAPWGGRAGRLVRGDVTTEFRTLEEHQIGQPYVYGRFAVVHLEDETRAALTAEAQDIVFHEQRRENFVIEDADWNPTARLTRRLEIRGFFQALYVGFLLEARRRQNKYHDIDPPGGGEWLQGLALIVNSQERILEWPPRHFQELANNTQMRRDVESELYFLVFGVAPDDRGPAGVCNLGRTQKVNLALRLEDVPADPVTGSNQTVGSVLGLSWNVFRVEGGVGRVVFED